MFDGPASEQTQKHRAAVLDLLDAVMVADDAVRVMQWRLTAKHAQAQLLTRAAFNRDQSDAAWAMTQARRFERSCTGLLLS